MDIKLNLINVSNDQITNNIVLGVRNMSADPTETIIAWKIIQNCGMGSQHPFTFPGHTQVCFSDSFGNYPPMLSCPPGHKFAAQQSPSGDHLVPAGKCAKPQENEVINQLTQGAINALLLKDGAILAQHSQLTPGQTATFSFKPSICIGVVPGVAVGHFLDAAQQTLISDLSLLGVASADIVMSGGGSGRSSMPYKFTLQNVKST